MDSFKIFNLLKQYAKPKGVGHFHHLLPLRYFNPNTEIFHNQYAYTTFLRTAKRNGFGCGFKLEPMTGTSLDSLKTLNMLICDKLPTGKKWSYQFCLSGNRKLLPQIEINRQIHSQRGGLYANLAQSQADLLTKALIDGFSTGYGKQARFDVKNYEAYFFASCIEPEDSAMIKVKHAAESAFNTMRFAMRPMNAEDMISYVGDIINHNPKMLSPREVVHNPIDELHKQVINPTTEINRITPNWIDIHYEDETLPVSKRLTQGKQTTRVVCLTLKRLPQSFIATQIPDYLASVNHLGLALSCPFLWSVNFQIESRLKSEMQAASKLKNLNKIKRLGLANMFPQLDDEIQDYLEIQHGLNDDRYRVCSLSMDLILYTTPKDYQRDVDAAMNLFRKGLELQEAQYIQGQILQSILPFNYVTMAADRQKSGTQQRVKSTNVVNFAPLIADYKGAYDKDTGLRYGLPTITARNQLAHIDLFHMGMDSFSLSIAGAKGSGKSVFAQMVLEHIVAKGGYCWALDKGKSLKNMVIMSGSKHIDASTLFLNPFTFLDIDKMKADKDLMNDPEINVDAIFASSINMIVDLYYAMANPQADNVPAFEGALLMQAILSAYGKHKTQTLVDHVVSALEVIAEEDRQRNNNVVDRRITDLIMQLSSYKSTSESKTHAELFNKASQLDPDVPFICIETESVDEKMMKPIIMALTIDINNRIINSTDGKPKAFLIEEAPQILKFKSDALEKKLSEAAATYRKKNASLIIVAQLVSEIKKNPILSEIYDKSAYKMVMLQDESFGAFAKQDKDNPLFTDDEIKTVQRFRPSGEAWFSSFLLKKYDGSSSEHRFFLDPYTKILTTTKLSEMQRVRDYQKQGLTKEEAITQAVNDFYGDEMKALQAFSAQLKADQAALNQPNQEV
ncbi:TraC family protein [Cysteiniphilum marinum]|uniref:TraC family protein n=1 Tax=Cysteiniphilum marinum TaxID=2774191 RepID=UPI00193BCF6F|nr:TraC family protein [Cysteiniphilum marinum]